MKTTKLFLVLLCTAFSFGIKAQVTVVEENTVKLGETNNVIYSGTEGKYGAAAGVYFGSQDFPNVKGTAIEYGNGESSGIFMDDQKVVIWSPGDENLVSFCDEDEMGGSGTNYQQAIIAYIDGAGYYYQISDSTSKEQIRIINSPLMKVMQLRGVEYYHKTKGTNSANNKNREKPDENKNLTREKKSGFLAQEVEAIIPEAVATNKAGIKYVNYQAVIPFLVEAVKEQQKEISVQAQQIKDLQEQINEIKLLIKKGQVK
jgi:hypothetical protein